MKGSQIKNILRGKTALVTGASSGLGADFARQLAECGCHLVLVARRAERPRELQEEISSSHRVSIECVPMDLVETDAPLRLYNQVTDLGRPIDVLVNNAGMAVFGEFADVTWENLHHMLELDIVAVTYLAHLFVTDMLKRGSGYVLFVSSIGAFQPSPTFAAYSAAKSYVLSLGEALHFELRRKGVLCTTLCPGVARTEFHSITGQRLTRYQRSMMMESNAVVRIGIEAMLSGRSSVVTGRLNRLIAWALRMLPGQVSASLAYWGMRESPH